MAITNLDAYSQSVNLTGLTQNLVPAGASSASAKPSDKQQASAAQQSKRGEPAQGEVDSAIKQINAFMSSSTQSIKFATDQDSGRVVVKVVDTDTQKVLRQIPSEEVLAISKALDKLQGLIIKETA